MGSKGVLRYFELGMVVGTRWLVWISQKLLIYWDLQTTISRLHRELSLKMKSSEQQMCGQKYVVATRGQMWMTRLVRDDKGNSNSNKQSLEPGYIEEHFWMRNTWIRWITAAHDHTRYQSSQQNQETVCMGWPKLDNKRTLPGQNLDVHRDIQILGSEFGVNSSKGTDPLYHPLYCIHPCISGSAWWWFEGCFLGTFLVPYCRSSIISISVP